MSLRDSIMDAIPYEARARSRWLTDVERELVDSLAARRVLRAARSEASRKGWDTRRHPHTKRQDTL